MADDKVRKTLTFKVEKETKNAVRFQEQGDVQLIGTLYVQKHALQALGNVKASDLQVTLELP